MVYIGLVVLLGSLVIGVPVCFSFLLAAIYYVIAGGYELTFITNNIYSATFHKADIYMS